MSRWRSVDLEIQGKKVLGSARRAVGGAGPALLVIPFGSVPEPPKPGDVVSSGGREIYIHTVEDPGGRGEVWNLGIAAERPEEREKAGTLDEVVWGPEVIGGTDEPGEASGSVAEAERGGGTEPAPATGKRGKKK